MDRYQILYKDDEITIIPQEFLLKKIHFSEIRNLLLRNKNFFIIFSFSIILLL